MGAFPLDQSRMRSKCSSMMICLLRESLKRPHMGGLFQIVRLTPHATCTGSGSAAQFHDMTVALIRYDAARRAIASAYRVDEVKAIRDKAEALRHYAKQANDLEMQNMAAEIRFRAERRAGELLADMGNKGERQAKEGGRPKKLSSSTTLPRLGITRDQSSKWQRLAMLVDDATFEKALVQAREKNGELTTAALLREVKEIMRPAAGGVVEPDINVIAAELIRDIESASRKDKLESVVRLRSRLNPTIRKNLISALRNAAGDAEAFWEQLSADFHNFPVNGKCHQRVIRELMAEQPEPDITEKRKLAADFKNAVVREISYEEAKNLILANEWLGNMGTTEFSFGLYFGKHLAGVACFGRTAGTNVAASVCGAEHAHRVATLCRGCSCWWAHPHSASFLISEACRQMTAKGFHIFVAYSDPAANEVGTVYQASNWLYCGPTNSTEQFRTPDGKVRDARQVHCLTRDRTGGTMRYKRTRAEQKEMLLKQGCEFFDGTAKHRYIGLYGDRRIKRTLRRALRLEVLPYPKRPQVPAIESVGTHAAETPITNII
jgi:hypothetical protein